MPRRKKPVENEMNVVGWAALMRDLQQRGQEVERIRKQRERRRGVLARLYVPNSGIRINYTKV